MDYFVEDPESHDISAEFYCLECGNLIGRFSVNEFSRLYPSTSFICKRCEIKIWDDIKNRKTVLNDKMIEESEDDGKDRRGFDGETS